MDKKSNIKINDIYANEKQMINQIDSNTKSLSDFLELQSMDMILSDPKNHNLQNTSEFENKNFQSINHIINNSENKKFQSVDELLLEKISIIIFQ